MISEARHFSTVVDFSPICSSLMGDSSARAVPKLVDCLTFYHFLAHDFQSSLSSTTGDNVLILDVVLHKFNILMEV